MVVVVVVQGSSATVAWPNMGTRHGLDDDDSGGNERG